MKSRLWLAGVAVCFVLGGARSGTAANYYINDSSSSGDIYTSATGNDANPGTTNAPKLTLANVIGTCNLQPGDAVYIDTGTYGSGTTISNNIAGTLVNPIRFIGSTNRVAGGSTFMGSGVILTVRGSYLNLSDIQLVGGTEGLNLTSAQYCNFDRVYAITNSLYGINLVTSATSNQFRRCVAYSSGNALRAGATSARDNYIENSILFSSGTAISLYQQTTTNINACIIVGSQVFNVDVYIPSNMTQNILFGTTSLSVSYQNLADIMRIRPLWSANTVADPLFVNSTSLDFHVYSPMGYLSNGVWATNAALSFSPVVDFGALASTAYTNELDPNGGRVDIGLYGGTAEASKGHTNDWLFAMSFNDGGNLIRTGRLEWVGGNLGAGATVNLQFSTNNGTSWSNIATGVAATNESYTWVPAIDHPSVYWRVVSATNPAAVSTNARPFSVRTTTNTVFNFYVNDDSSAGDVYCSALGSNANSGIYSNVPKRSLQAILDVYDLEGGDTVYVDTGDYATNQTQSISTYDSGFSGRPVRIIGSPRGAVFNRSSTSANTLELSAANYLEIDNLRLTGGAAGVYGFGAADIVLQGVRATDNQTGIQLQGGARYTFDKCVLANNNVRAFYSSSAVSNQWMNGVMWDSPTLILAATNSITVSNSILGNATTLFGSQYVPGDYNLVWNTGVGLTYTTFAAFQNAGLGWEHSLYADPLFANSAAPNYDFHVKSVMGRYDTNTAVFVTNDVVHSPSIDLGDPLASYASEPSPNGFRLNVGAYGNTAEASKSRTNAWLQALSFMDGGTLDAAAGAWLRWTGGAYDSTSTVTLWLSRDNGFSWEILATNQTATNGAYFYKNTSTNDPSSLYAMWKVTLDGASPAVISPTPTNFNYRNGAYNFYVNDTSTVGDVYCTAIGSDANLGVSPGSPMLTLHTLINTYKLGPGDRVYVDTGLYTATNAVTLTAQDSGVATNPVSIIGSTNRLEGGSVFGKVGSVPVPLGFDFRSSSSNIVLRNVVITNDQRGVAVSNSTGITLDGVEARGCLNRAFDLQNNTQNVALVHCVVHGGGIGVYLNQASNVTIRNSIFWENTNNAVFLGSQVGLVLENSVLASTVPNAMLYSCASLTGCTLDYNNLHAGSLVRVGVNRTSGLMADNLAAWQALSGQDLHSVPGNPQFADSEGFDYHLKTEQTLGRLQPNGSRTSDTLSSPLLDAGNPATAVGDEPAPNGGRVNIGRYGGTAEASMAPDYPWLKTVSFGDAGSVTNGTVPLRWTAGGGFTSQTVKVEVSVDGGKTWGTSVTSGLPATNGLANWTVAGLPDTPAGAWRVVCLENTNIWSQSTNFFAIRNSSLNIYIGTADTNDAIYITTPARADNWMATTDAPLSSVKLAFDRFDLEAGDRIWIDAGTYEEASPITVGLKDSGTSNNPVRVTGYTPDPYRRTVLKQAVRTQGAYGIDITYANGVLFDSLVVSNAYIGIRAENSQAITLQRIRAGYCYTNVIYAGVNARLDITGTILEQSLAVGLQTFTSAVVRVQNSLLRDNSKAALLLRGGSVELKNSILKASGSQAKIYYWAGGGALTSDYNNIRVADGAYVAGGDSHSSDRFLIDWQISTSFSNDVRSFGYEPMFADESALDFHLKSAYGRYVPASATWTNDDVTSRLIDLGDPASVYANEPTNNGGRINVGLYGNTTEASKSSGVGSLVPITISDGGTVRGTVQLYWAWNGLVPNERVNVEFSGDAGATWTNIALNIYADIGSSGLSWTTTNFPSTAQGVWRVCTTNGAVCGQTEILFAIKNDPLAYYLNDYSIDGDVYCTAPGSPTNTGLSPDSPLDSLETLLGRYKVEHGDTVYVDTGIYPRSTTLEIDIPSTSSTNYLIIQGSTNEAAGGSIFTNSAGSVIDLQGMRHLEMRDMRLLGGEQGLTFTQASSNRLIRVRSEWTRGNAFNLSELSDQNRFIQCAALNFFKTGFYVAKPLTAIIPVTTNYWNSGVIACLPASTNGTALSTGALIGVQSGRIYVSNSVFVANSPEHVIHAVGTSNFFGNYNAYHRPYTNSLFARIRNSSVIYGMNETSFNDLATWSAWSQADSNSLAGDPLFVDLAGGDIHPRSEGGHYNPQSETFEDDPVTSPLIDAADPAMSWSSEPESNGRRANLGVYGGTVYASRTPSKGSFVLLTLNEGGMVRGTQILRWITRGGATNAGHMVNIQISTNSGVNFATISPSLASAGSYTWDSTTQPSLPTFRWRVQSQSQPTWVSASERDFAIHNSNLVFYVNDSSTDQDAYTTAPGSVENTGLTPASPLSSVTDVLTRYDVEPGDTILLDTGQYNLSAPLTISYPDCGTVAEPVVIQGSTNYPGTVLSGAGFQMTNVRGLLFRNLKFNNQTKTIVVAVESAEDITFNQFDIFDGKKTGINIVYGSNIYLRNFLVAGVQTNGVASWVSYNTRLENGTIWSNGIAQVVSGMRLETGGSTFPASYLTVSNCILGAFGLRTTIYSVRGQLYADYNDLYRSDGALTALEEQTAGFEREYDSVGNWSTATGQDGHSLSREPGFADLDANDFHLKSSGGRFNPATSSFVLDPAADDSVIIDAGDPALACTEPIPNGGRVNLGRYGNTSEASKTPTNCRLTWISFNDGGRAAGTNVLLTWLSGGAVTSSTVTISYSADGGTSWSNLVTGLPARPESWTWDSTRSEQSVQAYLKIEGAACGVDIAGPFSVRNQPFHFYINDSSITNDVYCSAVGNNANSGLSSSLPMADLNALLAKYDLESGTNGGDVVYIDTGVYRGLEPWRISQADTAGSLDLPPIIFQGNTNALVNGTVLDRSFNPIGIQADYGVGFELRNITVSNTVSDAIEFNSCYGASAKWMAVGSANAAFRLSAGSQLRLEHCVVYDANQGIIIGSRNMSITNIVFPVIDHCAIWGTAGYAIELKGNLNATIRHCLLSVAAGYYVYGLSPTDVLDTDYNAIWLPDGGRVFERARSPVPIIYETMGSWAAASGQDLHSYDGNPMLANSAGRDFHLLSRAGRWSPAMGTWTTDVTSSPLIDAGDPTATDWTNEPVLNGSRVNIGLYGATPWASKSETNSALHLVSLNRGGVASGQVVLNWKASGMATGHTVRLEVSIDNGATWTRVADGIAASLGGVVWNSLSLPSSPLALWRAQDEVETNITATSELNFVLHNGPVYYYVNDDFTNGDVYCTAIGVSSNTGASPGSPKRWVSEVLDQYNLEPSDVIYVDTGIYQTPAQTTVGDLDAGDLEQGADYQVNILGSTNETAGGSIYIISNPDVSGFNLQDTYGVRFSRLAILGASNGLALNGSYFIGGEWLTIRNCQNGVSVAGVSSNLSLTHSAIYGCQNSGIRFAALGGGALYMGSCAVWSNQMGVLLERGYARVSNTLIGVTAHDAYGFYVLSGVPQTELESDYNGLFVNQGDSYAGGVQTGSGSAARTNQYDTLSAWSVAVGQDRNSIEHDPKVFAPGSGDFHLKSVGGRYQVGIGWTNDIESSPLIDSGNRNSLAWTAEPSPNGRRLNIGMYGGSSQASKTPPDGDLIPIFPGKGAQVSGVVTMTWIAVASATNYSVDIDYSPDDQNTWTNIVRGALAGPQQYVWDSVPYGRSARAWWRITARENPTISRSAGRFILRNGGTIPYYVNDSGTNGDVYCTAVGDNANDGLTPDSPMASVQYVISNNTLAASDVIYVDAGTYTAGAPPIKLDGTDSGYVTNGTNYYVTIQGSTNPVAPTYFVAPSFTTPQILLMEYAYNVRVKDVTLRNAKVGVQLNNTIGCVFDNVRIENNQVYGMAMSDADGTKIVRSVLWKNTSPTGGVAVAMDQSELNVENSVLWGSPLTISLSSGRISVSNSVMDASGTGGRIYLYGPGAVVSDFRGDYNSYTRRNGALICEKLNLAGSPDRYNDIPIWSGATSADSHSMTLNPGFANEISGDFHEKSTKGRFTGTAWTNDTELSPLVDAGPQSWASTNEPQPNGGIINIGAYGNTRQASMTQTNPPWLRVISYNDEGVMANNVMLYWLHGGMPSNSLVRLDYSTDYEVSWHNIVSNLNAGSRQYTWDVASMPLSLALNWRVVLQSNTNTYDVSDKPVRVKPRTYDYYINDSSTSGDVWCTGAGLPCGSANPTNRATPLDSLTCLLTNYPVGAGDRIYIDTGIYPVSATAPNLLTDQNQGSNGAPLRIYGSTNIVAGGTLLQGNGTANGFDLQNTGYIEIHDIRVTGAQQGVALLNVSATTLDGLELFNNLTNGVWSSGSADLVLQRSRLWGNRLFGYYNTGSRGMASVSQSAIWGNRYGAVWLDKGLTVSNSILGVTNASPIFYEYGAGSAIIGDYNVFYKGTGRLISSNTGERVDYTALSLWQRKGRDARSLVIDPLFVNSATGNFHLQSRAGYWNNTNWAYSTDTSWAIDASDPADMSFTNEPAPNGSRLNIGVYGGTTNASRSDLTHPALLAVSFRDGGSMASGDSFYWLYRGLNATNTVRIDYSPNGGASWYLVDSHLPIGSAPYTWYSTVDPTPEAAWRVVLESDTNISDHAGPFILRTRPLTYYVNDTNTDGDIYTTAPGDCNNLGYVSNSPLCSIQAVLAKYQLAGGDEIKVDTGVYQLTNSVLLTSQNSGDTTNEVKYTGSTNWLAGGSRYEPVPGSDIYPGFWLFGLTDARIANFRFVGFTNGMALDNNSARCTLSDLDIQGSKGPGMISQMSKDITMQRITIREGAGYAVYIGSGAISMDGGVIWSNNGSAFLLADGVQARITNTAIQVSGVGRYCYQISTSSVLQADCNNINVTNGAQIAMIENVAYDRLPQWLRGFGQDPHTSGRYPWFYDLANGDFHLRSTAGRYQPGLGWTFDTTNSGVPNFSALIDMGSTRTAWSNEPAPNGSRRNVGLYGNTWQASKSNTNRWLRVITCDAGGMLYGGVNLYWLSSTAIGSNEIVQLEYSYNDGREWTRIGEATAGAGELFWQTDLKIAGVEMYRSSPAAKWRVFLRSNTNVWDISERFGLRNQPFMYYINDTSTVCDLYTIAPGHPTNTGFWVEEPIDNLTNLLREVDVEPTDEIFIDTGVYLMTQEDPIRWEASDGGAEGEMVQCYASTNCDGVWFAATNPYSTGLSFLMQASYVNMHNLKFSGGSLQYTGNGLVITNQVVSNGALDVRSDDSMFSNCRQDRGQITLAGANNSMERMSQRWGEMTMSGTNVLLRNSVVYTTNNLRTAIVVNAVGSVVSNCTVVATRGTAVAKLGYGTLRLGHNILVAGGSDANSVVAWLDGGLLSDWNNLLARDSAWLGLKNGKWEKLSYWRAASGVDANSLSFEPLFQNEAIGDFHLNSLVGRWSPTFNTWDVDGTHSPLIDAGDPMLGTLQEPYPNGNRRNLGAFGGTEYASKSLGSFWLTALTQNDGGVLKGTNVVLRWAAGNVSNETVTLQYYDGSGWVDIVTGLSATVGTYVWNTTGFPDSFSAYWRVVAENGSGVSDQTDQPFQLRNFPHDFFINDGDTSGDIYCTAVGNDASSGLSNSAPKATLQAIFNAYDLEGGDTVYLDTGTYSSTSDVRIIWSRSGDTNGDVTVQGNTNSPYASVIVRSGVTNHPAMGLDIKASKIRLANLSVRGVDRAIGLESNRNVTVSGVMVSESATGIAANGPMGTEIRNSGFWNTGVGVNLQNTRTSVLENLTFVGSAVAGILMNNTEVDTLQNNIFVPAPGAYAYSIGTATSLLASATMDYNLYDFGAEGSGCGFFAGATNSMRHWQLGMNRDFRSAMTNANLANPDLGDFHPLSEYGRWDGSSWTADGTTSWAVDHGDPDMDYSQEPADNGERLNVGMYGNTVQASKGSTDISLYCRTMNDSGILVSQSDQTWPWIWSAHLLDSNDTVSVEFSGDCGLTWITLTNVNAYTEYFVWRAGPEFQTAGGRWRVVSANNTNVYDESDACFLVRYRDLGFLTRPYPISGLMRFDWEGGVSGRRYIIEYSEDFGQTWRRWEPKYNGPATINKSDFVIPNGGSQISYTFEDRSSYLRRTRWYRIWELEE